MLKIDVSRRGAVSPAAPRGTVRLPDFGGYGMPGILVAESSRLAQSASNPIHGTLLSEQTIKVGLVCDEPIRLVGLRCIFEQERGEGAPDMLPVAGTMEQILSASAIGYLVLDLNSSSQGPWTLELIRRTRPDIRLIVIGPERKDELIMDAIVAGARGYLDMTSDPATVRKAVEMVAAGSIWAPRAVLSRLIDRLLAVRSYNIMDGKPHLTARECQVLELILTANSNREIARKLGIEERTVKAHVARLMRKSGADNRIELSVRALNGWGAPPPGMPERRAIERRKNWPPERVSH